MKDTDRLGNPRREKVEPHGDFQPSTEVYGGGRPQRAAVATQTRTVAQARMFHDAQARLATMTPASAIQFLTELPVALLEVYLLAEETAGQNRKDVLRMFPSPGARARERFAPFATTKQPAAVGA